MAQTRVQAAQLRQGHTRIPLSFNNELHHAIVVDISESALASSDDAPRHTHDLGRAHLSTEKMHAPDACILPWRAHPTPSTQCDACAHYLARTNGGSASLHLLPTSASIGGSVPPRANVGGSAAPRTYQHSLP